MLAPFVVTISLIAIVYIGFVALGYRTDMKLVAYSSISHMGFRHAHGFFLFGAGRRALMHRGRPGANDLARLRLPPRCSSASA